MTRAATKSACPHCGRSARECWIMPCLVLGEDLSRLGQGSARAAKRINRWLRTAGAPFTVAPLDLEAQL